MEKAYHIRSIEDAYSHILAAMEIVGYSKDEVSDALEYVRQDGATDPVLIDIYRNDK